MVPPVHLLGHTQLRHVHLLIDVVHTVLEVLRQTVDGTVAQRGLGWIQRSEADVLQTCRAVQVIRPKLDVLNDQESSCYSGHLCEFF